MSQHHFARRGFLALSAVSLLPVPSHGQERAPRLGRIAAATVGVTDIGSVAPYYEDLLGYGVVEQGTVNPGLAASWGALDSAGRPYAVLQPATAADVFVRLVEIDGIDGFQGLTTTGWSSLEFVVESPDAHHQQFIDSPLPVLGVPSQLAAFPRIRAMQIKGPAEEFWHLTSETENWETSILAKPGGPIGPIFLVILAVPDVPAVTDWYATQFGMAKQPVRRQRLSMVNNAQGLDPATEHEATFLALAQHGDFLELWGMDENKATDRLRNPGQLPPGVALATFTVPDLDALDLEYISPPAVYGGVINGGRRSAVFIGPVGELVELIEELV